MVKNIQVDHFGPFWTSLDHFGMLTSLPFLFVLLMLFFVTPCTSVKLARLVLALLHQVCEALFKLKDLPNFSPKQVLQILTN